MFFIGIFGIETKQYEVKEVSNVICKKCGRMSSYKLIKQYNMFHFFFIPIFKWNIRYFLISRCCESIFEISMDYGKELERQKEPIINDNELTELNFDYGYLKKCPYCLAEIDTNYKYCPYCGHKIN
ncbi:zinc ribbon domain-containing protein [Caloramator sp. CAR-1]|uniref:zinc ribbon domain-containing protein n=1 Tax=Caloramator sp. CAR-1 TaxID=3062777 RepID=UPI0026E37AAA|nr:zinc ribbon domain-containing protein [Caloramator sp. CAR-1]MDO6355858.1 zinc ribbon domain-containing protein [Caloramator sp. CAR-1]